MLDIKVISLRNKNYLRLLTANTCSQYSLIMSATTYVRIFFYFHSSTSISFFAYSVTNVCLYEKKKNSLSKTKIFSNFPQFPLPLISKHRTFIFVVTRTIISSEPIRNTWKIFPQWTQNIPSCFNQRPYVWWFFKKPVGHNTAPR